MDLKKNIGKTIPATLKFVNEDYSFKKSSLLFLKDIKKITLFTPIVNKAIKKAKEDKVDVKEVNKKLRTFLISILATELIQDTRKQKKVIKVDNKNLVYDWKCRWLPSDAKNNSIIHALNYGKTFLYSKGVKVHKGGRLYGVQKTEIPQEAYHCQCGIQFISLVVGNKEYTLRQTKEKFNLTPPLDLKRIK